FFDNIQDAINAARLLRKCLPSEFRNKIKWFNSDMSSTYKDAELGNTVLGETWGFCTTDSFGMGMDVPDIEIIIQWRATCHLATLWQRLGCAARNKQLMGTGLLFTEKEHFDDKREARAIRKTQHENTRKCKAADLLEARNNKCRTVALSELPANVSPSAPSS
ncbi:uncharacterized protein EDB93DRAFT_1094132, partial [Suillus bovinus]|uniref:uncharacterized protein n=1 Tax=Suillus bovinus TaxID=48563 RepID=UPI001B87DE33